MQNQYFLSLQVNVAAEKKSDILDICDLEHNFVLFSAEVLYQEIYRLTSSFCYIRVIMIMSVVFLNHISSVLVSNDTSAARVDC